MHPTASKGSCSNWKTLSKHVVDLDNPRSGRWDGKSWSAKFIFSADAHRPLEPKPFAPRSAADNSVATSISPLVIA